MRHFKDIIIEKLRISKNNGVDRIKTTLRKFIAWYIGQSEFSVYRSDLEERNFISSNKTMTKAGITYFLYKHINDEIYVTEEEKLSTSSSKLYDYSFEIEGITFSIDARIYNDDELLSNSSQYIISEKLKVSVNSSYSLEDFDFDGFRNKLEKTHPISVSPYLDDDEEISYLYFGKYILKSIHSGKQNNYPDSIIFVFEKENDTRTHDIKYINSMEELIDMSKTVSGDFLKLLQTIYDSIMYEKF